MPDEPEEGGAEEESSAEDKENQKKARDKACVGFCDNRWFGTVLTYEKTRGVPGPWI